MQENIRCNRALQFGEGMQIKTQWLEAKSTPLPITSQSSLGKAEDDKAVANTLKEMMHSLFVTSNFDVILVKHR